MKEEGSEQTEVKTFDEVSYDLPELSEQCEVILAQDCSSSRLFSVIMSNKGDAKNVIIVLPGHKIDVSVTKGMAYTQILSTSIFYGQQLHIMKSYFT